MNNKEKNVIRHKLSDGLYIDPRLLRTGDNETEYFPFKPTEEECSPRPSVRGFGENGCLEVVAMVKPMADFLLVEITMKGEVTLLDDHDFTLKNYPIDENCKPIDKYGSLGLFRSHEVPEIEAIVIDKPGLDVACGAIGIGEITSIPTAPAIADAYCRFDGERRYSLPLSNTPYERKK